MATLLSQLELHECEDNVKSLPGNSGIFLAIFLTPEPWKEEMFEFL